MHSLLELSKFLGRILSPFLGVSFYTCKHKEILPFSSYKDDSKDPVAQRIMRNLIIESPFIYKMAVVSFVTIADPLPSAIHLNMIEDPLISFAGFIA